MRSRVRSPYRSKESSSSWHACKSACSNAASFGFCAKQPERTTSEHGNSYPDLDSQGEVECCPAQLADQDTFVGFSAIVMRDRTQSLE